jgi:hypothetical protein
VGGEDPEPIEIALRLDQCAPDPRGGGLDIALGQSEQRETGLDRLAQVARAAVRVLSPVVSE